MNIPIGRRLEYCAEVEPKLLKLAAKVAARDITADQAASELHRLVGRTRFLNDWEQIVGTLEVPKGNEPGMFRLREWDKRMTGDPRLRLYNNPGADGCFENIAADIGIYIEKGQAKYCEPYSWPKKDKKKDDKAA